MYKSCSLYSISASDSPVSHSKARFNVNTAFKTSFFLLNLKSVVLDLDLKLENM